MDHQLFIDHQLLIPLVIAYTFVGALIFTVVISCFSIVGWIKFENNRQQNKLFYVLVVELVVGCLGVFFRVINPNLHFAGEQIATAATVELKKKYAEELPSVVNDIKEIQNEHEIEYDLEERVLVCSGNSCNAGDWPIGNQFPTPYGDCNVEVTIPTLDASLLVKTVDLIGREGITGEPSEIIVTKTEMHPAYPAPIVKKNLLLCGYVKEIKDRRAILKLGFKYEEVKTSNITGS